MSAFKARCCERHPHLRATLTLPFWKRVRHPQARRHFLAWLIGATLMVLGHMLIEMARESHSAEFLGAAGGLIHAVGAVPILKHVEPLWLVIVGE